MDETVPLADVIEAMARKDEDVDKSPSGEMISRRLGRINGAPVSRSPFFNEIFSFSLSLSLSLSLLEIEWLDVIAALFVLDQDGRPAPRPINRLE